MKKTDREYISGGCTLWARQTTESEIFTGKPAEWFKIWFYIVNRANHADNGKFKRGQCFLKYDWITTATGTSPDQVKHCIAYLKTSSMLAIQKATRGMIVTICNYDTYQNLDNYKSQTGSHFKATQTPDRSHAINNNDQECNNDQIGNNDISPPIISPIEFMTYWNKGNTLPEIKQFSDTRKRMLSKRATEPEFAENWQRIIDNLRASAFHTGQNDRHWRATVDWILKNDTNYLKILECQNGKNSADTDTRNYKQELLDARNVNANNIHETATV